MHLFDCVDHNRAFPGVKVVSSSTFQMNAGKNEHNPSENRGAVR